MALSHNCHKMVTLEQEVIGNSLQSYLPGSPVAGKTSISPAIPLLVGKSRENGQDIEVFSNFSILSGRIRMVNYIIYSYGLGLT